MLKILNDVFKKTSVAAIIANEFAATTIRIKPYESSVYSALGQALFNELKDKTGEEELTTEKLELAEIGIAALLNIESIHEINEDFTETLLNYYCYKKHIDDHKQRHENLKLFFINVLEFLVKLSKHNKDELSPAIPIFKAADTMRIVNFSIKILIVVKNLIINLKKYNSTKLSKKIQDHQASIDKFTQIIENNISPEERQEEIEKANVALEKFREFILKNPAQSENDALNQTEEQLKLEEKIALAIYRNQQNGAELTPEILKALENEQKTLNEKQRELQILQTEYDHHLNRFADGHSAPTESQNFKLTGNHGGKRKTRKNKNKPKNKKTRKS